TTISFYLPSAMPVIINVIDVNGRIVQSLVNELMAKGPHTVNWYAGYFSSGIYYFKLETLAGIKIQKGILIK
ncbi:MAG: hypothetical protein U9N31_07195, partial [Candidatus Marinimicrobia bacterium]|nr:hypothetical protein [Candidatus Neomarinimicrobiota bacterium]